MSDILLHSLDVRQPLLFVTLVHHYIRAFTDIHRARKVKCDELKPVCDRCRSTGRVCDGYGIWGGGGNSYAERYCTKLGTTPPTSNLYCSSVLGFEEGRHLQWFQDKVVQGISGLYGADFWTTLILPSFTDEPAIAHAIIALSSAHRETMGFHEKQQEEFTLQQYTKAIGHLRPLLANENRTSIMVVLVACLLFILLEYTRGCRANAAVHLRNGLRLLKDVHSGSTNSVHGVLIIKPPLTTLADRAILRCFATLHVQSNLFGDHVSNMSLLLQATESELPSLLFASLEEARDSLYKLLHGILLLSQRMQDAGANARVTLGSAQDMAFMHLVAWQESCHRTMEAAYPLPWRYMQAYMLLLNHHTMATMMCKCMSAESQLIYDDHIGDFLAIVRRCIELWKHQISGQDAESIDLPADIGWIPPLYYTALKCRDNRTRLHAIRLLQVIPHREGVWDSTLAAIIATKVMQLEHSMDDSVVLEGDLSLQETPYPLDWVPCPILPESCRFKDVNVDSQEASTIIITCKRGYIDQEGSVLRFKYDGKDWHDMQPTSSQ